MDGAKAANLPFANCSVDYLQDIVAELRLLLRSGALPPEDRLRVLLTAAEVAHGQASCLMCPFIEL